MELLLINIDAAQREFYNINRKKLFMKNDQKIECAKHVCNRVGLESLIIGTIRNNDNNSGINFEYNIFKTFAHDEIYPLIINYFLNSILNLLKKETDDFNYDVHISLEGLTVSAIDRYKNII